ncbi:MAG: DUF2934 domain-containing protein [Candidatus Manganitrophaceae bacterium]|nr:MAG: DUF2934 domain-containing protein [Candidatus Manganitrophaceae bacterium]
MKKPTPKKDQELTQEETNGRMDDRSLQERIAERAYALYLMRGEHHGNDLDDWLEAERRVLSEHSSEHSSSEPAAALKPKSAPRAKSPRKRSGEQKAAS